MLSCPRNEAELNELLSIPPPGLIGMMKRLEGDIAILGVAGKMGVTMAMQAKKRSKPPVSAKGSSELPVFPKRRNVRNLKNAELRL